jgi:hypothetical protein
LFLLLFAPAILAQNADCRLRSFYELTREQASNAIRIYP